MKSMRIEFRLYFLILLILDSQPLRIYFITLLVIAEYNEIRIEFIKMYDTLVKLYTEASCVYKSYLIGIDKSLHLSI